MTIKAMSRTGLRISIFASEGKPIFTPKYKIEGYMGFRVRYHSVNNVRK